MKWESHVDDVAHERLVSLSGQCGGELVLASLIRRDRTRHRSDEQNGEERMLRVLGVADRKQAVQ